MDNFWAWLARKLPKRLLYFAVIHGIAIVSTGKLSNVAMGDIKAYDIPRYLGEK